MSRYRTATRNVSSAFIAQIQADLAATPTDTASTALAVRDATFYAAEHYHPGSTFHVAPDGTMSFNGYDSHAPGVNLPIGHTEMPTGYYFMAYIDGPKFITCNQDSPNHSHAHTADCCR